MRGYRRMGAISAVLARHGFGGMVDRLFRREKENGPESLEEAAVGTGSFPSPKRIRLVLEELGPSFVKLGQLMSTRADIFPPRYIEEFKKLQDRVPAIPFQQVKGVVEKELEKPLEEIFAHIDPNPVAAASVGQVHTARLFTGEKVAVKIIRPGIHKKIREDIRLMYALAGRIERSFEMGRIIGAVNLVREFERIIFRELDMLIEAGNMEKFAANFPEGDEIYIPAVYWDLTRRSILVMEHIDGIKMDDVAAIRAHGLDPGEVALIGLRSFSRQLMKHGFFHADPHPGNTIVMYDGRVSLVDFGIMGYLDEEAMRQIANIFLGYAEHDYGMVMDALVDAGLLDEERMDLQSFRADLKDVSESFYGRSLQHISVKDVSDQLMQLVLKYQIRLPRNLLLLLKTFIQTEALGKILGSDASILEVTRPYARELLQKGVDAQSVLKNLRQDMRTSGAYMKSAPKYLNSILKRTAEGRQRIEFHHSGFQDMGTRLEKSMNRLTVGLVIAASIVAAAMILNSGQRVWEFTWQFLGEQTLSLTALLGVGGYVIATVLGIWLIVSIFRSGRL